MANIFRFNGTRFNQVPGSLRQISAGNAMTVWGINDDDQLFRFNTTTNVFDNVPVSADIASVSVSQTGDVWILTTDQEIIRLNGITGSLESVPGELRQIVAASGGFAWGLNASSDIFLFENMLNKQIAGKLEIISTGPAGNAWGLNSKSDIFFSDPDTSLFSQVPGKLTSISVGEFFPQDNVVQVWGLNERPQPEGSLIREHDIFRLLLRPDGTLEFIKVPGELMIISAAASDVWGINAFHDVFRWNPQASGFAGRFDPIPGQQLDAISVGSNTVWGLSNPFVPPR
jgi:Tectonin domain